MASGRLLKKQISLSMQVNNLTLKSALLYSWSIAHADDTGLLPYESMILKAIICPLRIDITLLDIDKLKEECIENNLYREIQLNGKKLLYMEKFWEHQTLKKDRNPLTLLGNKLTWKQVEKIYKELGIQMEDNGIQMEPEEKRREEKRREVKRREVNIIPATKVAGVKDIMTLFYSSINPTISWNNRTTLKATEDLIKRFGLEKVVELTKYAISVQGKDFAPTITTPYQLKEKLAQLKIFSDKHNKSLIQNV